MNKNHIPIRMCIICKNRAPQRELNKFPLKILKQTDKNRNFYICNECISDQQSIKRVLNKNFKIKLQNYDFKGELNAKCSN